MDQQHRASHDAKVVVWSLLFGGIGLEILFRRGRDRNPDTGDRDQHESGKGASTSTDGSRHALG